MRGVVEIKGGLERSGLLPVIPQWSRSMPSSVSPPLRSTQVNSFRKMGSLGASGAPCRITGITGNLRLTNSLRQPRISRSCQGPRPSLPTSTAEDPIVSMIFSSSSCHGRPGISSHSSSHTFNPRARSTSASSRTAGLSLLLWLRKTSKLLVIRGEILAQVQEDNGPAGSRPQEGSAPDLDLVPAIVRQAKPGKGGSDVG